MLERIASEGAAADVSVAARRWLSSNTKHAGAGSTRRRMATGSVFIYRGEPANRLRWAAKRSRWRVRLKDDGSQGSPRDKDALGGKPRHSPFLIPKSDLPPPAPLLARCFLILPRLDELPLAEATRNWPHAEEAAAISLVRWLVLLKCCGSENSERAFYDPLLRELLLIPPSVVSRSIANLAGGTQAATSAKFSDRAIEMAS